MNIVIWCIQGLLAAIFLASGYAKGTQSKEHMLGSGQTGVRAYSIGFIRFIATCELLGAVGLVLPWALQIAPLLTPLAAIGLGVIMIGAARAHAQLHEPRNVAANLVLLALLVTVAWARWA